MGAERNVGVLRQILDGFNRHDLEAIMSHFAGDAAAPALHAGLTLPNRTRQPPRVPSPGSPDPR